MSQWKSDDTAANSPNWSASLVNLTPNTGNQTALFGNVTADAFVTGATVGVYGVDDAEVQYDQWKLLGVQVANAGTGAILTGNSTTGLQVNGATASVNAVINIASLTVGTAGVNAAGEGYTTGDTVEIAASGTGSQARLTVTANATGNVTAVSLVSGYTGDYSVFPSATANTTNVTGSGTGLRLDVVAGIGSVSVATGGTLTVTPGDVTNEPTTQAGQTVAGARITYVFKKTTTPASVGWNLVTTGSGNRAGRVHSETLVAVSSMSADAEDVLFPNT